MAKKKKVEASQPKTEHMSLRLDSRTKFLVEYWSQCVHQSDTAFVTMAVERYARDLANEHGHSPKACFHPHRGVREVRLGLLDDYPLDDVRARRRDFVMQHRAFFLTQVGDHYQANVPFIETLWDVDGKTNLDEYMNGWAEDFWAPGKLMAERLRSRGLEAPVWPPEGNAP